MKDMIFILVILILSSCGGDVEGPPPYETKGSAPYEVTNQQNANVEQYEASESEFKLSVQFTYDLPANVTFSYLQDVDEGSSISLCLRTGHLNWYREEKNYTVILKIRLTKHTKESSISMKKTNWRK